MEQPTALYLRGFTGDTFTGTAWQALDAQTLAEQTDLLYWLHKEGFYPQTQLAAASRGLQRQEQAQTVLIENTGACSAYVYAPYALSALPQEGALRTDSLESTQLPASGLRGARQYRFTMPLAPEQTAAELSGRAAGAAGDGGRLPQRRGQLPRIRAGAGREAS